LAARKTPGNQWTDKAWRDAIRVAVLRAHEDPKKGKRLAALADALVDAGLEGDVPALREIGDRLDGKVAQALEHTGKDGAPIPVALIELVAVEPRR
jgi:hypothetical protein